MKKFEDISPHRWKTVKVFISSTFRDFQAERDYLIKYIFSDLQQWCEQWKLHLVPVDLRWGITKLEEESGKLIDICFEEIDKCKPFFLCFLGNKYGSLPELKNQEKKTLKAYSKLKGKEDYSITHLEVCHAIMESLLPTHEFIYAKHAFFYFRSEDSLPKPGTIDSFSKEDNERYFETFFEQDQRKINSLQKLKNEIRNFYEKLGMEIGKPNEVDIRIFNYTPKFDYTLCNLENNELKGRFTIESLKELGTRVKEDLKSAITETFKERIDSISINFKEDTLQSEKDLHEDFVEKQTWLFVGREKLLKTLYDYIEGESNKIFAVFGETGSGKSTLLAKFYLEFQADKNRNNKPKGTLIIPHFVGATPDSTSLYSLLRRLCEEIFNTFLKSQMEESLKQIKGDGKIDVNLLQKAIREEYDIPTDIEKLSIKFKEFLIKTKGKTVIIIDALNQLEKIEHSVNTNWLPDTLPGNVKIIVSTWRGDWEEVLLRKEVPNLTIESLTSGERKEIIRKLPSIFSKTLDEKCAELLVSKRETGNPLYLRVALEELRIFGSHIGLEEKIVKLPSNTVDLFVSLFERLELEHGHDIIKQFFCLIECSRYGLTASELREQMWTIDKNFRHQLVLNHIREYLYNKGELIDFFHKSMSKAVRQKYLNKKSDNLKWHRLLAEHFDIQPLFIKGNRLPNTRKVSELPYHQIKIQNWDAVEKLLTDLNFIRAKCFSGMVHDLIKDYNTTLSNLPEVQEERKKERKQKERAIQYIKELIEYSRKWNEANEMYERYPGKCPLPEHKKIPFPRLVAQMTPRTDGEIKCEEERILNRPTRLDKIRSFSIFVSSEMHRLNKYSRYPMFCIQQAYNYADSGPVAFVGRNDLISSKDQIAIVRTKASLPKFNLFPSSIKTLEGHFNSVSTVSITPDATIAVSGSEDKTIRVWDIETGKCLKILEGHTGEINAVSLTPDGRIAISGSSDETLRIWDIDSGQCSKILYGHSKSVQCVDITPDVRLAVSGSRDETIRIWDISKGQCKKVIKALSGISSLRMTADGAFVIVGDEKGTANILDLRSGDIIRPLHSYLSNFNLDGWGNVKYRVTFVNITPDGKLALTGSNDENTLWIWNVMNGKLVQTLKGKSEGFRCAEINLHRNRVISANLENEIQVWKIYENNLLTIIWRLIKRFIWNYIVLKCDRKIQIIKGENLKDLIILPIRILWIKIIERFTPEKPLHTYTGHRSEITYITGSIDNKIAISSSQDGTLKIWDILNHRQFLGVDRKHHTAVMDICISNNGKMAASVSMRDSKVMTWDIVTGKCLGEFTHPVLVDRVEILPDKRLLISRAAKDVRIWSLDSGQCLRQLEGEGSLFKIALDFPLITPDKKNIVLSGDDRQKISFFNLASNEIISTLRDEFKNYTRFDIVKLKFSLIDFTKDSKFAITASSEGMLLNPYDTYKLRVWEVATGKCVRVIDSHESNIFDLKISSDSRTAFTSCADSTLRIYDIQKGKCIKIFNVPSRRIWVCLDGKSVILQYIDETFHILDIEMGNSSQIFEDGERGCVDLSFTSDNRKIIKVNHNGAIEIWGTDNYELLGFACHNSEISSFSVHNDNIVVGDQSNGLAVYKFNSIGSIFDLL